jgi:bacillithiol system protein YtxJ
MKWNKLESEEQLEQIKNESKDNHILIFKHSTRCPISSMALDRIERSWKDEEMKSISPYYLDLVALRNVSSKTAEIFNVKHESPQVLLIDNGSCVYDASHMNISYESLKKAAKI